MATAEEIRARVGRLPVPPPQSFFDEYEGVRSCLDHFISVAQHPMNNFMQHYSKTAEQALVMFDWVLSRDDPDRMPSQEELAEIITSVEALVREVVDSNELGSDDKSDIVARLEEILRLLKQVSTRGPRLARDQVNTLVGELIADHFRSQASPTATTIKTRIVQILIAASLMLAGSASDSIVDQVLTSETVHHAIEGIVHTDEAT